ncbi:hypothetical protein L2E82_08724 [Cichorium intybus]|uniref:Uncharacterized protein n=1 Tax=Cichorium intybus TaxID=13427 RepID=A0ACB9G7X3_CICIN|nr:hypothetical protein L2E82_08724 [Cichorium intybus]
MGCAKAPTASPSSSPTRPSPPPLLPLPHSSNSTPLFPFQLHLRPPPPNTSSPPSSDGKIGNGLLGFTHRLLTSTPRLCQRPSIVICSSSLSSWRDSQKEEIIVAKEHGCSPYDGSSQSAPIAFITTRVFQMGHKKSQVGHFFPPPETLNQENLHWQVEVMQRLPPNLKKQKVSRAFSDQSIEQLNDVTAVRTSGKRKNNYFLAQKKKVEFQKLPERWFKKKKKVAKCGVENRSSDVERCFSLCVEERMCALISNLIRLQNRGLKDCAVGLLFALLPILRGTSGILEGMLSMTKTLSSQMSGA